jgi:hypothetical protein
VLHRSLRSLVLYVAGIPILGGWAAGLGGRAARARYPALGAVLHGCGSLYTPHPTFQAGTSRIGLADRGAKMTGRRIAGHPRINGPDGVASDCHFEID